MSDAGRALREKMWARRMPGARRDDTAGFLIAVVPLLVVAILLALYVHLFASALGALHP